MTIRRQQFCKHGHDVWNVGVYVTKNGYEICKACSINATTKCYKKRYQPAPPRTHCINGHPYTNDNILITARGPRCKTCRRNQAQKMKENGKARAWGKASTRKKVIEQTPERYRGARAALFDLKEAIRLETAKKYGGADQTPG